MLDEKMVASVGRNLVKGAADPINSAFRYLIVFPLSGHF
jgi:hypothetical protein